MNLYCITCSMVTKKKKKKKKSCVFITKMKKSFKSSSFCDISNFYNGFVWNPSQVQRSLFERIVRFFESFNTVLKIHNTQLNRRLFTQNFFGLKVQF